jgi:hypothetical protein
MVNLYKRLVVNALELRVQDREDRKLLVVEEVEVWLGNLQREEDLGKRITPRSLLQKLKVEQRQDGEEQKFRGGSMVAKNKKIKKVGTKKAPAEVDVFESPITGMVYETTILYRNEPVSKDQEVAKILFHGSTGEVSIISLESKHEAKIESIIDGDMFVEGPPVILVSKADTPFEWIKAFPKATLARRLYASELVTYYENQ